MNKRQNKKAEKVKDVIRWLATRFGTKVKNGKVIEGPEMAYMHPKLWYRFNREYKKAMRGGGE